MRRIAIAVAVALACVPATAHGASFDGSCQFKGAVTFDPPMTNAPQPVAQDAAAAGTCNGTFTDRKRRSHQLSDAAATYEAQSSGDAVSCAFGLADGEGTLSFRLGRIPFTMHEYRAGATPVIELSGRRGGEAWMAVTPAQSSDPIAALEACNGTGLTRFELDGQMQTLGAIRG